MELRPIPGYGRYMASDTGLIFYKGSDGQLTAMAPYNDDRGYLEVKLTVETNKRMSLRVHRLVALTFLGERPEGLEIRHLDGNPRNNNLSNLAYGTHAENMRDRVAHTTHCRKAGHEYTPENTHIDPRGARVCRECIREYNRNRPKRNR